MIPSLDSPEVPVSIQIPQTRIPAPTAVPVTSTRTYSPGGIEPPSLGIIDAIVGGVGGFITGGPVGAFTGAVAGWGTGGGESPSSPGTTIPGYTPGIVATQCPTGYRWSGTQCVAEGFGGWVERVLPGGATGTLPETPGGAGGATMGAFGIPAMMPFQVGTINGGPILRCPSGAVLGKDNLCYMKGSIPNQHRKWPRGTRPLLTGGEMKTLRKIRTLENKVKRAWTSAGKPGQRTCRKK